MDFLKPAFESGRIDFEGQNLASTLSTLLIACAGGVALAVGFALQRLDVCFYAYALCIVAAYAVVLPPWPFFRRHPLVWLPRKGRVYASTASSSSAQSRRTLVEDVSDDDSC
ncbi:SPC12-domain-containing protein [Coemansia reversa NRRL 1564]|uniref:Signal peptidase complex subunit 1 n=1 Tax=Coemansia reversa (strain ATCC 12441 / NRRL 1564) TaxID=763665 RepID=A0A2G5B7S8_COERN|nr:SPC12-domain-containing protein [Coemansia reversa NRRL 1564]|eukprot:PIA14777.1 SPC12-domain-containing protein [Coemansia reversa NRRL 1564]